MGVMFDCDQVSLLILCWKHQLFDPEKKWNSEIDMITKMLQEAQAMYGQCGGKDWKGYTRCKASVILRPAPPQLVRCGTPC